MVTNMRNEDLHKILNSQSRAGYHWDDSVDLIRHLWNACALAVEQMPLEETGEGQPTLDVKGVYFEIRRRVCEALNATIVWPEWAYDEESNYLDHAPHVAVYKEWGETFAAPDYVARHAIEREIIKKRNEIHDLTVELGKLR